MGLLHITGAGNSVALHRCTLEGAKWRGCMGLMIGDAAQAVLVDSSIRHIHLGGGIVVWGQGSTAVAAGGSSVSDVAGVGVTVMRGGSCVLEDARVVGCMRSGAGVHEPGSKLLAKRSKLDGNRGANLIMDAGMEGRVPRIPYT